MLHMSYPENDLYMTSAVLYTFGLFAKIAIAIGVAASSIFFY